MKLWLVLLLICSSVHADDAKNAKVAQEFIYYTRLVRDYLVRDLSLIPEIPRAELNRIVTAFEANNSLISLVAERPLDPRGIPKAALFNRAKLTVQLHEGTWLDPATDSHQKGMIAAMELLGMAGMDHGRYETVAATIFPQEELIDKLIVLQRRMCLAVAHQSTALLGDYYQVIWCLQNLRGSPKGWAEERAKQVRAAAQRCEIECAYDDDLVLQKGWCTAAVKYVNGDRPKPIKLGPGDEIRCF